MSKPSLFAPNVEYFSDSTVFQIKRRDIVSGWINTGLPHEKIAITDQILLWKASCPIFLPNIVTDLIEKQDAQLQISERLYHSLIEGVDIDEMLDEPDYISRLDDKFEILSTRFDEADPQELISVDFDAVDDGELIFDDIWMRISWLSFLDSDESIRFRFSFGMEGFDDVSQDFQRQLAAADLCEKVFPESSILSENAALIKLVQQIVEKNQVVLLERIVYFNAKNGGAQFHHDAEKGHLGVVYAQLTGQTLWLTLSKKSLMAEIQLFFTDSSNLIHLRSVVKTTVGLENLLCAGNDRDLLESILDDPANEEISELLNESSLFFSHLINNEYAYVLDPGDVMLLPQQSKQACAWHSVFCLGEKTGQALSFAIKCV